MRPFDYRRAGDAGTAIDALKAASSARILAGGTNLVDLMKYDVERPSLLVDIGQAGRLAAIAEHEGGLSIGALATNAATAEHPAVLADYPLLAKAILSGATPQLRNRATAGGNINQRTRCYYFYDPQTPCNKREPGTGCPAREGVNRIHAVLGASDHCVATHPSDMCVALAVLEAEVLVQGPQGERRIPFADYHRLPGDQPHIDNTLSANEMVLAIELPAESKAFAGHYSYLKLRDRLSYAFALVSVAAALEIEGGTIRRARLALGGVAHKPWRRPEAEALLEGRAPDEGAFAEAAALLLEGAHGLEHNAFKIEMARRAVPRALAQAAAGTPQSVADKRIL
jgi:xanthine dehydrogenase YagS FAD-binding subunit